MTEKLREFSIKPLESVALLSFFLIMPLHQDIGSVANIESWLAKETGNETTEDFVPQLIRQSVTRAATKLQHSLIKSGVLRDDGVVEAHPVVHSNYVAIYLKLPATVSVHNAFHHIRTASFTFLQDTGLEYLTRRCRGLFTTQYLALSSYEDPYAPKGFTPEAYQNCADIFLKENGLLRSNLRVVTANKDQLGSASGFMSDKISVYD